MMRTKIFDILPQNVNLRLIDINKKQLPFWQAKVCGQSSTLYQMENKIP